MSTIFTVVTNVLFIIIFFSKQYLTSYVNDRFYPYYHLAPPFGWMNDPNGFCIFNKEFHLFYQYNPLSSQDPGTAHWGHAKSFDLFHWEHMNIAMYPDKDYDQDGVFSGSAIIVNKTMNLLYTGNVNHPGAIPDHTQRQALSYSTNGANFVKYAGNPVIMGEEYQPNIRDPKVWQYDETFYMVLGNSFNNNTLGRVLLFSSKDLISWKNVSIIYESDGFLGYMWECPDFFELNGKFILLFSPQGMESHGDHFKNLYQTGYIVGDFNYKTKMFFPRSKFQELDAGHDFYATQTILDAAKRRIVVAWFSMWEEVYPERNDGWAGQLTIPRELHLTSDLRLIQKPVKEIKRLRSGLLYSGIATAGTSVKLINNVGEIKITASIYEDFNLKIESDNVTVTIKYDNINGKVSLDRGGDDGIRRTNWKPATRLRLQIFVDRSSIEVFWGDGEITFSSRFFPYGDVNVRPGENSKADIMVVYSMKHTIPAPQN